MILTGKLDQVTSKMSKTDVTGQMGLSWIEHSTRHFGREEMLDRRMPVSRESNRKIKASRKVMAGMLSLIAWVEKVEEDEEERT